MSNRLKDIPELSRDGSNLHAVAQAVREVLQTFRGYRGDKLDQALTLRALKSGVLAGYGPGGTIIVGGGGPGGGGGGSTTPDLTPPPTPTGLEVTAGFSFLAIEHDVPTYTQGHGHDRTVVYGSKWPTTAPSAPVFSDAVQLFEFQGSFGAYPTDPSTRWCIWIKWKSVDGVLSVAPAGGTNGAQATTAPDPRVLLDLLTGQITASQLYADLGTPIALITQRYDELAADTLAAALAIHAETQARAASLLNEARDRGTAISDVRNVVNTGNAQLAQSITTLTARVQTGGSAALAAVEQEALARASADAAEAAQRLLLAARLITRGNLLPNGGFERGLEGWTASHPGFFVWDSVWGRAILNVSALTGAGSLASEPFPVQAGDYYVITGDSNCIGTVGYCYFDMLFYSDAGVTLLASGGDGPENPIFTAHDFSSTDSNRAATAVQAQAPAGATWARGRFGWGALSGNSSLGCRQIKVERGQLPATPYTLEGSAVSISASVQQEASTRATQTGALFAQWTVKLDLNGYVSGFGLASTGGSAAPTSAFIVRADSFAVASPSGPGITPAVPFIVQTVQTMINGVSIPAGVYMDAAFIYDLTASIARLGNAWIDDAKIANLSAAKLTVGDGTVGGDLKSTVFTSGSAGWRIRPNGTAEFSGVVVRGTIYASAGSIGGITIGSNAVYSSGYVAGTSGWRIHSDGSADFQSVTVRGSVYTGNGTIGGSVIATAAIHSPGFSAGTSGWQLKDDGNAEFNNITARGTVQSSNFVAGSTGWRIKNDGSAEFSSVVLRNPTITRDAGPVNFNSIATHVVLSGAAAAALSLLSDGRVQRTLGTTTSIVGNWYLPTTAGIGSSYKVVASATGDNITDTTRLNREISLSSTVSWALQQSGSVGEKHTLVMPNVLTTGGALVCSGVLNLNAIFDA